MGDVVERGVNWKAFAVLGIAVLLFAWGISAVIHAKPHTEARPETTVSGDVNVVSKASTPPVPQQSEADTVCDSLKARSSEIDPGSVWDRDRDLGPIPTVDIQHRNPEYKQLVKCSREALGSDIFLSHGGLSLGMSLDRIVNQLHTMNSIPYDRRVCCWLIREERVIPANADLHSNVREMAFLTQCFNADCLNNPYANQLELDLDSSTTDAKLLSWVSTEYFPVAVFRRPGNVIRFVRSDMYIGPPDTASETEADWYLYRDNPNKPSETVYMKVRRVGSMFELEMNITDADKWGLNDPS